MTLATFAPAKTPGAIISVDCPKHGHILHTENERQAEMVSTIHNKAYHPRTIARKLNKKR